MNTSKFFKGTLDIPYSLQNLDTCYARFTLADPMPRLCPDAVGGESGSTYPMHARPGPCRAGTSFTLADAPAHCRPNWIRSRVHYDSLSCTKLKILIILTRVVHALYNTNGSSLSPTHSFLFFFFVVLLQVHEDVGAADGSEHMPSNLVGPQPLSFSFCFEL